MKIKICLVISIIGLQMTALCQKKIIWCHNNPSRIEMSNLDGTNRSSINLIDGINVPIGIFVDQNNQEIYWTDRETKTLNSMSISGENKKIIHETIGSPQGISVDLEKKIIYFAATGSIRRYDMLNETVEILVGSSSGFSYPKGIKLDLFSNKMYWTDSALNMIRRANLDGTEIEDIITEGLETPSGIAIDKNTNKIYWTDRGIDKIQRANLDGSNIETIIDYDLDGLTFMSIYGDAIQKECNLGISPNPTINLIQVESGCSNYEVIIRDAIGRVLYQKLQLFEETEIDVSRFSAGVYFVTMKKSDFKLTKKFVKI